MSVLAFVTAEIIIINMLLAKVILYPLLWIQKDFYKCDCIRYCLLILREMVLLSSLLLQMIFLYSYFRPIVKCWTSIDEKTLENSVQSRGNSSLGLAVQTYLWKESR